MFRLLLLTVVSAFNLSEVDLFFTLGDSLSAGFGILNNEFSKLDEYRGLSGFAGCDDNSITFPNLIRNLQKNMTKDHYLEGCSTGQHFVEICYNYICPPFQYHSTDNLNVAQSGAMVMNLQHEYDQLMSRLSKIPDWENKNKLGLLVIGANDACLSDLNNSPDYTKYFDSLFLKLNSLPNTKILVFPFFHISGLVNLSKENKGCSVINRLLSIECVSAFISDNSEKMDNLIDTMNTNIISLSRKYQNIIIKNIFRGKDISDAPYYFLSLVDCFHISQPAHETISINMFNSLFGETVMNYSPDVIRNIDIEIENITQ